MRDTQLRIRWWTSRLLYVNLLSVLRSPFCSLMSKPLFQPLAELCALQVEDESRSALLPQKQGTTPEQTSALEDTLFKVSSQLSTISRMQKYFRTRENRNFSTVRSTEQRIFNFSLVEVGMMVGMAALQVLVVRFFFQGARKGYV